MNIGAPLWHYTCRHRAAEIQETGIIIPQRFLFAADPQGELKAAILRYSGVGESMSFVWATTEAHPDAHALGLTHERLDCDRTECRFKVLEPLKFVPWNYVRKHVSKLYRDGLEREGGKPEMWWVAWGPVRVIPSPEERN